MTAVLTRAKVVQTNRMTAEAARTASTLGFRLVNTQRWKGRSWRRVDLNWRRLCATAGDPGSSSCLRQAASVRKERENREMLAQKPSSKEISLPVTTNEISCFSSHMPSTLSGCFCLTLTSLTAYPLGPLSLLVSSTLQTPICALVSTAVHDVGKHCSQRRSGPSKSQTYA